MIGKQFKNQSFRSTLEYVLGKEKATIIDSNMGGTTPRQLAKEFGAARRMRPNLQRACAHVILSIPHRDATHPNGEYHEHLEDERYAEIAQRWLKEMKFLREELHKSQYMIARHHDTDHEHIHIIASRIRMDGSVVSDSWDYRRSEVVVRQLEQEFGLEAAPCSSERVATRVKEQYGIETTVSDRRAQTQKQKHHSSGKPPVTQLLADIIDEATQDKPTVTELIKRLQQQGVMIHPQFSTRGVFKEAMGEARPSGIAFEMNGVKVAGNKLGSAYSFPGLQKKRGVSYDPERDLPAIRSCAAGELVELPPRATEQLVGVSPKGDEQLVEATPPGSEQLEIPLPVEVPPSTTEQLVLVSPPSDKQLEEVSLAVGEEGAEDEVPVANTPSARVLRTNAKPDLDKGNAAPVPNATFQATALTLRGDIISSVPVGDAISGVGDTTPAVGNGGTSDNDTSSSVASTLNSGNQSVGGNNNGDTDTNNQVVLQEATQQQNYANSISPAIQLFWSKVGRPEKYFGNYYDLKLDGDILKLRRKSGEEIAKIPLNANADAEDKGLTKEDLVRLEKLKALLLTQNRQQEHQNQVDME